MLSRFRNHQINWVTSSWLIGTLLLTVTAVPAYLWRYGIDWFQFSLFVFMFAATGFSITLGYHRLFSHLAFKAHWGVRLFTLIFGAAAFQNSAFMWCSEHRTHHKHVDHDDDPYDITKGFFYAHMGWLLIRIDPPRPYDNVPDLKRDRMVMWQHRHVQWIAVLVSFAFPASLGWMVGGPTAALGAFLLAGVARVTFVQHMTFFINSMCHTVGSRPYSSRCSARDSWIMALFTYGEGYHNYHHEFQHDYRNGVKPWQFDPTKWWIWALQKAGLASGLRRVPEEKILLAELGETQRLLASRIESFEEQSDTVTMLMSSYERLQEVAGEWEQYGAEKMEVSREMLAELKAEIRSAVAQLRGRQLGEA